MSKDAPNAGLEQSTVQFLSEGLSIHLGAASDDLQATLVRALGCRVDPDHRRVRVLFPGSRAQPLLAAIRANGRVAAVFSEPETHRTLQIKGLDATVERATAEDYAAVESQTRQYGRRLAIYAIPESYASALCHCDADDLLAVSFTALTAFRQTPGQDAGQSMRLGSALP
jgi:hypothetical protein